MIFEYYFNTPIVNDNIIFQRRGMSTSFAFLLVNCKNLLQSLACILVDCV